MAIKSDAYNNTLVFSPSGDLSAGEGESLRKLVEAGFDQHRTPNVVLDLEKVGFVDSEGLEAMLWLKRRCEDALGTMKLAALDENVRKILEITRLAHCFECHDDLPGALRNAR